MSKLKIGDEVKLRKKWIKITNTLDVIRDEENETKVGVPNNIDIKKTYEVFDIDVDESFFSQQTMKKGLSIEFPDK